MFCQTHLFQTCPKDHTSRGMYETSMTPAHLTILVSVLCASCTISRLSRFVGRKRSTPRRVGNPCSTTCKTKFGLVIGAMVLVSLLFGVNPASAGRWAMRRTHHRAGLCQRAGTDGEGRRAAGRGARVHDELDRQQDLSRHRQEPAGHGAVSAECGVYVPKQYVPGTPAPFIVAQDGMGYARRCPKSSTT